MQDTNINSKLYKGYESRNGTDDEEFPFFNETPYPYQARYKYDAYFRMWGVAA